MEVAGSIERAPAVWLNGRAWDLTWLFGTSMVIPAMVLGVWAGAPSTLVNLGVTALIGGPHLFATYTATYLDPGFRRAHRALLVAASLLVPALVVFWGLKNLQILLSGFIFLASLHVLQQVAYLCTLYRARAGNREGPWAHLIDAGFLMLSFYPVAAYKLVNGQFKLGEVPILIPSLVRIPLTWWATSILFALFAIAWAAQTVFQARRGLLNRPKALLIGVTAAVAFVVPALERSGRLELVFQAVNAWHSLQYLAFLWLVRKVRSDHGQAGFAGAQAPVRRFYLPLLLVTLGLLAAVLLVTRLDPLGLSSQQYYFTMVLSVLLVHYALDAYLFAFSLLGAKAHPLPYAAPALA